MLLTSKSGQGCLLNKRPQLPCTKSCHYFLLHHSCLQSSRATLWTTLPAPSPRHPLAQTHPPAAAARAAAAAAAATHEQPGLGQCSSAGALLRHCCLPDTQGCTELLLLLLLLLLFCLASCLLHSSSLI